MHTQDRKARGKSELRNRIRKTWNMYMYEIGIRIRKSAGEDQRRDEKRDSKRARMRNYARVKYETADQSWPSANIVFCAHGILKLLA